MNQPEDDGFTAHALNRCFDRHGFIPTVQQAAATLQALVAGRGKPIPGGRRRGDSAQLSIRCAGHLLRVVFSPSQRRIVTILPPAERELANRNPPYRGRPKKHQVRAILAGKVL